MTESTHMAIQIQHRTTADVGNLTRDELQRLNDLGGQIIRPQPDDLADGSIVADDPKVGTVEIMADGQIRQHRAGCVFVTRQVLDRLGITDEDRHRDMEHVALVPEEAIREDFDNE